MVKNEAKLGQNLELSEEVDVHIENQLQLYAEIRDSNGDSAPPPPPPPPVPYAECVVADPTPSTKTSVNYLLMQ